MCCPFSKLSLEGAGSSPSRQGGLAAGRLAVTTGAWPGDSLPGVSLCFGRVLWLSPSPWFRSPRCLCCWWSGEGGGGLSEPAGISRVARIFSLQGSRGLDGVCPFVICHFLIVRSSRMNRFLSHPWLLFTGLLGMPRPPVVGAGSSQDPVSSQTSRARHQDLGFRGGA